MCRSRRELSNEYLLAKIGVDTAENEPCKVCPLSAYRSPRSGLGNLASVGNLTSTVAGVINNFAGASANRSQAGLASQANGTQSVDERLEELRKLSKYREAAAVSQLQADLGTALTEAKTVAQKRYNISKAARDYRNLAEKP